MKYVSKSVTNGSFCVLKNVFWLCFFCEIMCSETQIMRHSMHPNKEQDAF